MAVFSVPIIYYAIKAAKKRKTTRNLLHHYAAEKGLKLDEIDTWRFRYGIGIDLSASTILYMEREGDPVIKTVDLNHIDRVDLQISYLNSGKNGGANVITDLQLSFIPHIPGSHSINLEFFSTEKFFSPQNEYELIRKWEERVREVLKRVPSIRNQVPSIPEFNY